MDQNLRQLFLQTTNPNDNIRNNAEGQLKALEKNVEFLNYVRNVLMMEKDRIIQQISSIYFMNVMKRNWKCPELASVVEDLERNILYLLTIDDRYPKLAYQSILHEVFKNAEKETIMSIFNGSAAYLSNADHHMNRAALILFEEVFKSDTMKLSIEDTLDVVFNSLGAIFNTKFTEFLAVRKYSYAGICMKIIAKSYGRYSFPDYLANVEVFREYIKVAVEILRLPAEDNEGFMKMQKWAAFFLYKSTNKGLKKYFRNDQLIEFVRNESTLAMLYATFTRVLEAYTQGHRVHDRIPLICADFFTLCAINKRTRGLVKSSYMSLLSSFILPSQSYNSEKKDKFEDEPENYLRERYNYYSNDLQSSTAELFTEILRCDAEIETGVISSLKGFLDMQVDDRSAPMRYGIVRLLAGASQSLRKLFSNGGFHQFLVQYIFADVSSQYPFLVSQALYFLSLMEPIEVVDGAVYDVLNKIVGLVNGSNEVLSVEACMSLSTFFFNESLQAVFKPIVPGLFEKALQYTRVYLLESLTSLCDSIIDCFIEEITTYAPLFVQTICASFMEIIDSEKDEELGAIAGYLTTIEKLVMTADDKPEVVENIYSHASRIIYYVFKNQKVNFFQECFDLMNSFMFAIGRINESMFEIFILSLSGCMDELSMYSTEISDFIDNYLSYGREAMITPKTLELIYKFIDTFMPLSSTDCSVYDEELESACRIIDSLMLNAGTVVHSMNPNLIPAILHRIVANYDKTDGSKSLAVFGLESIMNCFIVAPSVTVNTLGTFLSTFFAELALHKEHFIRVYDKKLLLLFLGNLFKMPTGIHINYEELAEVFVLALRTLPDAIKKRNKLKDKEEADEESEGYSDDTADSLIHEDIYFETILDKFDAYDFARSILSSIASGTVGEKTIAMMASGQISQIKRVLETTQEIQK